MYSPDYLETCTINKLYMYLITLHIFMSKKREIQNGHLGPPGPTLGIRGLNFIHISLKFLINPSRECIINYFLNIRWYVYILIMNLSIYWSFDTHLSMANNDFHNNTSFEFGTVLSLILNDC